MSDDNSKQALIEPGTWKARAVAAQLGYTSGGNDQVGIGFLIAEGPSAGRAITYYGGFSENSWPFTYEALRNSGWTGDDLSDYSMIGHNDAAPYLVIAHEPDLQGVIRARVKWVNGGAAIAMKDVMGPGEAKAFAARMRGSVMAMNAKAGAKAGGTRPATGATPATHAAATGGGGFVGDDIPF